MRWLFYLLLAGNALLLGSELRQLEPQAAEPVPVLMPATVNRLLLLGELEVGALRERRASAPVGAPEAAPPEPEAAPAGPPEVATAPPGASPASNPGRETPAAAMPVMTLADAVAAATRGFTPAQPPVPTSAAKTPPIARLCYSVGPLESAEEVDAMRGWLQAHGGEPALREDERREVALYWVHFPPLPDRAAAVDRVERMRAEAIDDIFIIPGGDMRNAVSLGVYSQPASLERRLGELRSKGYDPSVVNRYRTSVAAWFDVSLPGTFKFDGEDFATRFPIAQFEPVGCG